jgi:hypothetical protein
MSSAPDTQPESAPLNTEQNALLQLAKNILNPNGKDPNIDEYINATFGYILGALHKVSTSDNKEAAAREIAEDLTEKFETWKADRENRKAQEQTDDLSPADLD